MSKEKETPLLPCPFCGRPLARAVDDSCEEHPECQWAVHCPCCCQTARYYTKAEAIVKWNQRTPAPRQA